MKKNRTSSFINILPQVVDNYNNSYHSSIGMTPLQVNDDTLGEATFNLYYRESDKTSGESQNPKYKVGEHVMISRLKEKFKKGYTSNYSDEVFKIYSIDYGAPIRYTLSDICDEESVISGKFYEQELAPVVLPTILDISEVVSTEKRRGRQFFEVKFVNKPECKPEFVTLEQFKRGALDSLLKSYEISK